MLNITRIVLSAGHSLVEGDPGAIDQATGTKEASMTVDLVERLATLLKPYIAVAIVPHALGLKNGISWVNKNRQPNDWAIEIHKDSAAGLSSLDASTRVGVYHYGGNQESAQIGAKMQTVLATYTGNPKCWNRPDTAGRFGRLGWLRDINAISHLIEAAFIQGNNSPEHNQFLAEGVLKVILSVLSKEVKQTATAKILTPLQAYYIGHQASNNWQGIINDITDRDREIFNFIWKRDGNDAVINRLNVIIDNQRRYSQHLHGNNWAGILIEINNRDLEIQNFKK